MNLNKETFNSTRLKSSKNASDFQEMYEYLNKHQNARKSVLISIILPLYNEEKTIRSILEDLPKNKSIEVIIIDDHSSDNSLNEIRKVEGYGKFKIIRHLANSGYGKAIITGMQYATGDVIVCMDTDGQHSPADILDLIKPIFEGEADYTIGSRYLGSYHYRLPIATRLGEILIEKLIQFFFGIKIMNNQNGFRAFDKKLIPLFSKAKFLGYAFCTEQILQAKLSEYRILECPVKLYNREFGYSKIRLRKLTLNIFACLLIYYLKKFRLNLLKKRKTIKGFLW